MIENFSSYIHDKNEEYIIFDVGSRDCKQSIEFYKQFPKARIFAFECNPNTLELCKENIVNYSDRITLIEGAVCDYDGTITFYPINQEKTITSWKDGNPGASSIFKSNGKYTVEKYVQDEIISPCHRLDTIINNYDISHVDIIWMDLQGAELLALKGLGDYINTVKYIHTEVSYTAMYENQVMYPELNNFILSKNFILKNNLSLRGWQEDAIYERYNETLFDIVIPVGPNDDKVIETQINYTKENIIGYRNIYLVCYDPSIHITGCITINENIFPFNINTVSTLHGKVERNGWYLQQLIKLYSGTTIPNILPRYLVIDSDTFFLRQTTFISNDVCLFNHGVEYHKPYFTHMSKLYNGLVKIDPIKSGICHHMIFETQYIKKLIEMVEEQHNDKFYHVFLKCVDINHIQGSGASEYEIYFNFMLKWYPQKIKIRPLKWANTNQIKDYDYISYHWYMR